MDALLTAPAAYHAAVVPMRRIEDWPTDRYHFPRCELDAMIDADLGGDSSWKVPGVVGSPVGRGMTRLAESDPVVQRANIGVGNQPLSKIRSSFGRSQVWGPLSQLLLNEDCQRHDVVRIDRVSRLRPAFLTRSIVADEDERPPVTGYPSPHQHRHISAPLPVWTRRATRPGCERARSAYLRPLGARLAAERTGARSAAGPSGVFRAGIPRLEPTRLVAAGLDAVGFHPSGDGAQRALGFNGNLAEGQPLVFVQGAQPLPIDIGPVPVANQVITRSQDLTSRVISRPTVAVRARFATLGLTIDRLTAIHAGVLHTKNYLTPCIAIQLRQGG